MKIIFMGTPEFASPTFKALAASGEHKIVAVFTQMPKPKGRKLTLTKSIIHQLAEDHNIPVYTPKTLRNGTADALLASIEADIIVVVAYGFIIPKNVLEMKKYGCLNIHPSKLPRHRGAAPLQRTLIAGDKESAVCIMQMDEGLDTGDIIMQEDFAIAEDMTLSQLHDKCAEKGAELLLKTLSRINELPRIRQSDMGETYAYKLTKEEGEVQWLETAFVINCKRRGMTPWPGIYFYWNDKMIKIIDCLPLDYKHNIQEGSILNAKLHVACGQQTVLAINTVKPEGRGEMSGAEFLRGHYKTNLFPLLIRSKSII